MTDLTEGPVHTVVGEDWADDDARRRELLALVAGIHAPPERHLALSIDLGGMLVLAGDAAGLAAFEAAVPPVQGRFPMRLANHAAFHTALQEPVAGKGRALRSCGRIPSRPNSPPRRSR